MSDEQTFENIITVKALSHSYSVMDSQKALENVSLAIREGSYTAIVGSNGSGKSSLCRLICGLLSVQTGEIWIAPQKRIGLVFQSPKDQIVSSKVYRDTAFGPINLRLKPSEVELRTIESLSVVELLHKAEAPTNSLSLGQTQKLALAGVIAINPDILILDEAVAMLDSQSRESVYELLRMLHSKGKTIIHIAHDLQAIKEAQSVIGLEKGKLFFDGSSEEFLKSKLLLQKITGAPLEACVRKKDAFAGKEKVFSFKDVCFAYDESRERPDSFLLNNISFDLHKGTLTALTGVSGAGKSTLLELGAGLLNPDSGEVCCKEHPALAQQNCAAALFEAFAADDVAFGPRNLGIKGKALVDLVHNAMDRVGLPFKEYGERSSIGLSGGEQRRLAIAGILALNKDILFFDEPTAGLDGESRINILNMLRSLAQEGKTVLYTTHNQQEADFADAEIKLEDGKIENPQSQSSLQNDGLLPPMPVYSASSMIKSLKGASASLSGSGWKVKSMLEKLPPVVRLILFFALFVLSLCAKNLIFSSVMLGLSIVYCLFANFRIKRLLKSFIKILPFLCFFAIFQIMFRQALPDEVRYTSWRFFTITPSKLLFCLNSILRTYAALYCISAFFVSTPEQDLIDGFKIIIPSRNLILVLEVIFRFIPLLVDEAELIIKTQIIRGGLGSVKGKLAKIRAVIPLIVPLIIRTFRRSEALAEAIVMRGFHEK